jgi:hypothetical protein
MMIKKITVEDLKQVTPEVPKTEDAAALACTCQQCAPPNFIVLWWMRIKNFVGWYCWQRWQETNLVKHAKEELKRAGLMDKDSVYDGMLGKEALRLIKAFSGQGHSGMSAHFTLQIFNRLATWNTLTPLTNDPTEWNEISTEQFGKPGYRQSRRQPAAFSDDGLKTWYSVDDKDRVHTPLYSAVELKAQAATTETTVK